MREIAVDWIITKATYIGTGECGWIFQGPDGRKYVTYRETNFRPGDMVLERGETYTIELVTPGIIGRKIRGKWLRVIDEVRW